MAQQPIIPGPDGLFDTFQDNLVSKVVANKVAWGIPDAEITILQGKQAIWAPAWLIAKVKTNRTPAQVEAKDDARTDYEKALRPFIQKWIVRNTLMTDENRKACGVKPRDLTPTEVPVPATLPQIDIKVLSGHRAKVHFKQEPDEAGISRRGKPEGVKFCEFAYSLDAACTNPENCPNTALASRSPQVVQFEEADAGKKVFYFSRWVNTKGQGGPWTDRKDFMIP